MIHTNELPIRHLIKELDGPTTSKDGFKGEVCSLLKNVEKMEYNPEFKPIEGGEDLVELTPQVLNNMSTDSILAYKICQAVKSGDIPDDLKNIQIGPLNHARWLNTQTRIIYMTTRKHGLEGKNLKVLSSLAVYAVQSYFKLFFDIKVKHKMSDAPEHILTQLRILKTQPKEVCDIVTPYIKTGAWTVHSENLLISLLISKDQTDRKFAVQKLLEIRGDAVYGNMSCRTRRTPDLNQTATRTTELILWEEEIHLNLLVFTCSISTYQTDLIDFPMEEPPYQIHTQSTERSLKAVTEAVAADVGHSARDGFVRARVHHSEKMPSNQRKI